MAGLFYSVMVVNPDHLFFSIPVHSWTSSGHFSAKRVFAGPTETCFALSHCLVFSYPNNISHIHNRKRRPERSVSFKPDA